MRLHHTLQNLLLTQLSKKHPSSFRFLHENLLYFQHLSGDRGGEYWENVESFSRNLQSNSLDN